MLVPIPAIAAINGSRRIVASPFARRVATMESVPGLMNACVSLDGRDIGAMSVPMTMREKTVIFFVRIAATMGTVMMGVMQLVVVSVTIVLLVRHVGVVLQDFLDPAARN